MNPCELPVRLSDIKDANPPVVQLALKLRDPDGSLALTAEVSKTSSGTFNLVFIVTFSDEKELVVKIPQAAHKKGDCACWTDWRQGTPFRMESEVGTLRQIKRLTSIPVPIVYSYNTSFDNEVGFPYIVMQMLPGRPAGKVWRETVDITAEHNEIRTTFLHKLAGYVLQLNRFECTDVGYPVWDESYPNAVTFSLVAQTDYPLNNKEADVRPLTSVVGRDLLRAYLLGYLARELHPRDTHHLAYMAEVNVLRESVFWAPVHTFETADYRTPAVLTHPDLDLQNILVDEFYNITGLIDWDGIRAVPRCLGNEALPRWLIHDCSGPRKYHYRVRNDDTIDNPLKQDSPAQMAYWRGRWVEIVASYFWNPNERVVAAGHASRSLYWRLVELAGLPHSTITKWVVNGFLRHVMRDPTFTEAWREIAGYPIIGPPPITFHELIANLREGPVSFRQWDLLRERFVVYDFASAMHVFLEKEKNREITVTQTPKV